MSMDKPRKSAKVEVVDVEEDEICEGWAIAPTEACALVAIAVFTSKKDAEAFREILRARKASNTYDDLAILLARATVLVANSYDVKAGRKALAKETP